MFLWNSHILITQIHHQWLLSPTSFLFAFFNHPYPVHAWFFFVSLLDFLRLFTSCLQSTSLQWFTKLPIIFSAICQVFSFKLTYLFLLQWWWSLHKEAQHLSIYLISFTAIYSLFPPIILRNYNIVGSIVLRYL